MLETLKMSLNPIGAQAVQQSSVCCWTALPLHCVEHSEPQGIAAVSCPIAAAACDSSALCVRRRRPRDRTIRQRFLARRTSSAQRRSAPSPTHTHTPPPTHPRGSPVNPCVAHRPPPYAQEHPIARVRARPPKARQRALPGFAGHMYMGYRRYSAGTATEVWRLTGCSGMAEFCAWTCACMVSCCRLSCCIVYRMLHGACRTAWLRALHTA